MLLNQETYRKKLQKSLRSLTLHNKKIDEVFDGIKLGIIAATRKLCSKRKQQKESKLKSGTRKLLKQRRKTDRDAPEYNDINKTIEKEIRKDLREYKTIKTLEENKNMKTLRLNQTRRTQKILKVKSKHGMIVPNK